MDSDWRCYSSHLVHYLTSQLKPLVILILSKCFVNHVYIDGSQERLFQNFIQKANPMKIQVNRHGMTSLILTLVLILVHLFFVQAQNNATLLRRVINVFGDPYVLFSVILYILVVGWFSRNEVSQSFTLGHRIPDRKFNIFRILLGAHITFVLLILGLLLTQEYRLWERLIYIMISLAVGFVVPQLLVSRNVRDDNAVSSN